MELFLGLVAVLLGGGGFFCIGKALAKRDRRRVASVMVHPELGGVPLPVPDDPRWRLQKSGLWYVLGVFWIRANPLKDDRVIVEDEKGEIMGETVNFTCIGEWPEYVEAVRAGMKAQRIQGLAAKALKSIEDAR